MDRYDEMERLAAQMRDYVISRNGPAKDEEGNAISKNGAWTMMLQASDAISALIVEAREATSTPRTKELKALTGYAEFTPITVTGTRRNAIPYEPLGGEEHLPTPKPHIEPERSCGTCAHEAAPCPVLCYLDPEHPGWTPKPAQPEPSCPCNGTGARWSEAHQAFIRCERHGTGKAKGGE